MIVSVTRGGHQVSADRLAADSAFVTPGLAAESAVQPPEQSAGAPAVGRDGQPSGARADPVRCVIVAAVAVAYSVLGVTGYFQLATHSWDLGIFTEYVKQFAHLHAPIVDVRRSGYDLLGDHFHPIVALIAPFFRVFPSPVTLLVAQALLAAVSVVPVSRAAAARLGTRAGG